MTDFVNIINETKNKNKHKNTPNSVLFIPDEYMKYLFDKCTKTMVLVKNPSKINDDDILFPTIENYNSITKYNYNLNQLKVFVKYCNEKYYKQKISGNKKELLNRIYSVLSLSSHIIKIQKIFRGFLRRKYNQLHGPAYKTRHLCTNNCDFVTMEELKDIQLDQFISYKDVDNFIYGFDISSLYNMVMKHKETKNPYNRNNIPSIVLTTIKQLVRFSKALNVKLNLTIEDDTKNVSIEKAIELRTLSLFQTIDSLGNYSNPQWFHSLNRNHLIKMMRELIDIWNYRAQLSIEVKRNICPPCGDPFRNLSVHYIQTEQNMNNVKKVVLEVLEKLVNSGIDNDTRALGAYYVLGSITLVNSSAATALPWLYQSFCYF
jgi:hypothetical protein